MAKAAQDSEPNVVIHKIVQVRLKGISPYSQSRYKLSERNVGAKGANESPDDFERRTWLEHAHVNEDGHIVIPAIALKCSLDSGVSYLNEKIKGEGQRTWTRMFVPGVYVDPSPVLCYANGTGKLAAATTAQAVEDWILAEARGQKRASGGSRIKRLYPTFHAGWIADVNYHILSTKITYHVFKRMLEAAGMFCGVGRFRAAVGGYYGRYQVENINW